MKWVIKGFIFVVEVRRLTDKVSFIHHLEFRSIHMIIPRTESYFDWTQTISSPTQ